MRSQFQVTWYQKPRLILLHCTALHFLLQISCFHPARPLKSKKCWSELMEEVSERTSVEAALGSSGAEAGGGSHLVEGLRGRSPALEMQSLGLALAPPNRLLWGKDWLHSGGPVSIFPIGPSSLHVDFKDKHTPKDKLYTVISFALT